MSGGFVIKIRGSAPRIAIADYECPVHGRFEAQLERDANGDPPERIGCTRVIKVGQWSSDRTSGSEADALCPEEAEYRISAPLARVRQVEAVKGGWAKPERSTWLDTRDLGEGQSLGDWRERRAQIREEERKKDVMRFVREHHESVIGRDV